MPVERGEMLADRLKYAPFRLRGQTEVVLMREGGNGRGYRAGEKISCTLVVLIKVSSIHLSL